MNNKQFGLLALSLFVVFLVIVFGVTYQKVTGKVIYTPKSYKAQASTTTTNSIACTSNLDCNDNNACTKDTCKRIGTYGNYCVYEPSLPCCGNGDCEKGENCATCSIDCTGKKDGCITGYSCLNGNCVLEQIR